MNRETQPQVFRAWAGYITAYLILAVPVRLVAVAFAETFGASTRASSWMAQLVAGAVLLPVSYLLFRRAAARLLRDAARADSDCGRPQRSAGG